MLPTSSRSLSKLIKTNFGNRRNFAVWLVLLLSTLYCIDEYFDFEPEEEILGSDSFLHSINSNTDKRKCNPDAPACHQDTFSFLVVSGEKQNSHPAICFDGQFILNVDKNNSRRGLNVAIINDKTLDVEDIRVFDTYSSDSYLRSYLSTLIPDNFIIIIASYDDVTYNLSDESKVLLESFGSNVIKKIKFRDSFVMIGQKNLKRGQAIEKLTSKEGVLDYAARAEISGCISVPVGELESSKHASGGSKKWPGMGEALINCGVRDVCDKDSFSFHAFTGDGREDLPKVCINGKYVFAKGLNMAGRGLNVAVISPITGDVIKLGVFDTYANDGTNAEIFLEMLNERDIVVVVTFDDASTRLNINVQNFFESLGSAMINRLAFRDAWVFVGQKGIRGLSPIEKLNRADGKWPESIEMRMCVPFQLKGIQPNKHPESNRARKTFCELHRDVMHSSFCSPENAEKFFEATPFVQAKSITHNDIYRTPIIIIPGADYKDFQVQIESLLRNPGVRLDLINVLFNSMHPLYGDLAHIYGIRSHSLFRSDTIYNNFYREAFRRGWDLYKNENHMIFLGEKEVPTTDFLSFLAQCTDTNYYIDNSLVGVSSWNPYGGADSIPSVWYRSNALIPGSAFLMKRLFYMNYLTDHLSTCCAHQSWIGWNISDLGDKEFLFPSLPRSYHLPHDPVDKYADKLFANKNTFVNEDCAVEIESGKMVLVQYYERHIKKLIDNSKQLSQNEVETCIKEGRLLALTNTNINIERYSIYYEQKDKDDLKLGMMIAKCFNYNPIPLIGSPYVRKGIFRLPYKKNIELLLIGSETEAFSLKKNSSIVYKIPQL